MVMSKFRNRLAGIISSKANTVPLSPYQILSMQTADIPIYTDLTVHKAVREGYKISGDVYQSIRIIVKAASGIPWVVLDKDDAIIPNHPFSQTWANPNKQFSGQDNMELIIAHQLLVGNSLIQPIIVGGIPREFWVCMPDLIHPIPSDKPGEWLRGYEVTSADGTHRIVPPEQFIHFMMLDPGNPYWGTGPLQAVARTVDTDNEAQDTQKISMQNRGTPDGIFETDALTNEQYEEANRQIQERYLTKERRRMPWVIAGAKWHQMSLTPVEMDLMKSRLNNKRDIAGGFGISSIFLGDMEHSTYANMAEARKALYEDVALPMLDDVKSTLNLRVAPLYGDNITISYDTSKVVALRGDQKEKAETAKTYFGMGIPFNQINERLEMGFTEFPGWGVGYLPLTLLPVGSAPVDAEPKGIRTKALNLDSEEKKAVHWKRIDSRRVAWWGMVSKRVEPLYRAEGKELDDLFEGKKPSELIRIATYAINSRSPGWEKVMTAISTALIEDFGNEIAEDLGGEKSITPGESKWVFDPFSAAARAWIIKHGAESIKTILETNLDDVKMVILAGRDENLTTTQIAKNIRQFYTDRSPFKAMRVARTEVASASGFGQREAAKQSGIVKTKGWMSSRDDRVRDSHVAIDGEKQPLDESYSNGLMYPGDPSGNTAEFIMCRCVESYQTRV